MSIENLPNEKSFHLELGDIIQIFAPSNDSINEETFYISYIDESKIKIINIATYQLDVLDLNASGFITDESIQQISLLSRADEPGYCRQNGLITSSWIEIHLGGELPTIITGEITNLDEDMIEITTFPEKDIIYIDFEYKGIPEHIPIDKILLRDPIVSPQSLESDISDKLETEPIVSEDAIIDYNENGEMYVYIPENIIIETNINDKLQDLYLNANELFGKNVVIDEIDQSVELPEHERRYGLDIQLNDFMDELLSTIPMNKRTPQILNHVHNLVSKFKELRNNYSTFDNNGNVIDKKQFGKLYKPLVPHILNMDTKLNWIIPVIKHNTHVFTNEEPQDILNNHSNKYETYINSKDEIHKLIEITDKFFDNTELGSDQNKYKIYLQSINKYITPFENINDLENNNDYLLYNREVETALDTIVDNYPSFKSAAYNENNLVQTKFVMQKYNLGFSSQKREVKNGQIVSIRNKITPSDKISIKSFLFMPLPILQYSMINLPNGFNILQRSNVSHCPLYMHRVLKKSANIPRYIIDGSSNHFSIVNKLNSDKIQEIGIDPNYSASIEEMSRMKVFLESVIPNNHTIINTFKDVFQNKYSMIDVIKCLEPFLLYMDNISYGDYKTIRFFVNNQIKKYIIETVEKSKNFNLLKNAQYYVVSPSLNVIDSILKENSQIYNHYIEYTDFNKFKHKLSTDTDTKSFFSSSEQIVNLINIDNLQLFSKMLSFIRLSLVTNFSFTDFINPPIIESMDEPEKIKFKNCSRRFLTKRYSSMNDLQKDNEKQVLFYDKEFDDTPYHLMKLYSEQKKKMKPNDFMAFLKKTLIDKHNCPPKMALRVAVSLIDGNKFVLDGEYAILEIKPVLKNNAKDINFNEKEQIEIEENVRKITQYYKRVNNHWILDKDIEHEAFMDNNTLYCNSDFSCVKNQQTKTCDTDNFFKYNIAKNTHQNVMKEFDKRIEITFENLQKQLLEEATYLYRKQTKNKILKELLLCKSNYIAYDYGKTAIINDVLESPYKKHFDLIMSQSDFSKKQNDIVRFYNLFCREPLVDKNEKQYWAYCLESNIELVPMSIYQLAKTFVDNGDYKNKLDELCEQLGELSEDGDCIIDKYCKCVLRNIDFVSEEGYDESGFKIISNDFIQPDIENVISNAFKKTDIKRIYENETSQMIFNVLDTLCQNMNVSIDTIYEFVMSTVNGILHNSDIMIEESKYNSYLEREKNKKTSVKELPPYEIYKNKIIIILISSTFLIAIQTVIPSIRDGKTFSGCIRSFAGYPMDGIENISGIKYISCVLHQIKTSISPWNSIMKTGISSIEKNIKEVIEKFLIERPEIIELYKNKRDYLILHSEDVIPNEHNIKKWTNFLPPIVNCSEVIKDLTSTTSEFDSQFYNLLKNGHHDQRDYLHIYQSKILLHTYGIIQNINSIVKKKDLLLKTMSKVPFLENSCCNDSLEINPINYFVKEDKNIHLYIKRCSQKFSKILEDVKSISFAPFLFNNEFTGFVRPSISNSILKTNIYEAFIQYCNFENRMFIPEELKLIIKEKPPSYKPSLSILEKIFFLEKHGKHFRENDLHSLMNIIHRRNLIIVDIQQSNLFNGINTQPLNDLLNYFEMVNSSLCEEPLRKLLKKVLDSYQSNIFYDIEDYSPEKVFINSNIHLNNYLEKCNQRMHDVIIQYLKKFGNLTSRELSGIDSFIDNLIIWKKNDSNESSFVEITQFIRNSIYHMTKVFPHVIINSNYFKNIPTYKWGLSNSHIDNITSFVEKQYEKLNKFINVNDENIVFKQYLQKVELWSNDISLLVRSIPTETSKLKFNETTGKSSLFYSLFKKETILSLFKYLWLSTLYEFIQTSDDEELLKFEKMNTNKNNRNQINENNNPSNFIFTNNGEGEDPGDNIDDIVQIEIIEGNKLQLKNEVSSLLMMFISIETQNKKMIDITYQDINSYVSKTKKQEKDNIITIFENMGKTERGIEKQLKNFKLNRWNVGKEVYQYDKKTYNANEIMKRMFEEVDIFDNVNEPVDVNVEDNFNYDYDEGEYNNIDDLNEDFMDGNYYQEDGNLD